MTALRLIALSATCLALASCENMKKSGSSDPYASNYGSDGHYNPYPGQSGYASSAPKYQTPPAPAQPEPPNPYAFSSSKKPASASTGKSSSSRKTVASSGTSKKHTPTKSSSKKSSGSRYTVSKGDTLSAIARKKGSSVAKIKAANGLHSDLIRPGQSLKIP